jgi:hypothetical protein
MLLAPKLKTGLQLPFFAIFSSHMQTYDDINAESLP